MAIVTGAQGAGGSRGILSSRRKIWMRDRMVELDPDLNKVTLILRKINKKSVGDVKFQLHEHDRFPDTTQANGTYTSGATSIVVDDGTVAGENQLVINQRTGEVIKVTAISSNTWTVSRSVGSTAAAAGNDNDYFSVLATSFAENSNAPDPRINPATNAFNYTQIAREDFGASGTLIASDIYGSQNIMSSRAKERLLDYNAMVEKSLLFGERSEDTSGNYAVRSTGGIHEFMTQSVNFGGAFSMQLLFDACEVGFRYGSPTKSLFVSRSVASNIGLEAVDKLRAVSGKISFGVSVSQLVTPSGNMNVMTHNMLEGGEYAQRAYLLDLKNFGFRYLKGRDNALYEGLETNGTDGEVHGWMGEFGLERGQAKTHQVWTSVSNG